MYISWNISSTCGTLIATHTLTIDIENIYFLIGMSQKGIQVVLSSPWGGEFSLDDMIDRYCLLGMHAQSGKLPIKWIVDHPLRIAVYTIKKFVGTISAHLNTMAHMLYSLECMALTVFNWCKGILVSLKDQLNKRKWGKLKQFDYGVVVVSFIL